MILLLHRDNQVVEVRNTESVSVEFDAKIGLVSTFFLLAGKFPEEIIIWSHIDNVENIDLIYIESVFNLKNCMFSFSEENYFTREIEFIEDSPFVNTNTSVVYPTWQMSSDIGAIYSDQLLEFSSLESNTMDFGFVLNVIAKIGMPQGLFCYSDPNLLIQNSKKPMQQKASMFKLFRFIKQHYKGRWTLLLMLNILLHKKRLPLLPFLKSIFVKRMDFKITPLKLSQPDFNVTNTSVDVIIPTIGRKEYLYDVVKDLSSQSLIPKQLIIIEQSIDVNSASELDFLDDHEWPFIITHKFIHETGACNARNLALNEVNSDYVFLADDDIRIAKNTLENALKTMLQQKLKAITLSCLQEGEKETRDHIIQWTSFGSGCSIVKREVIDEITFDLAFENGFGEDADFGMQIRKKGVDIYYISQIQLQHLKAPIGGFRFKVQQPWESGELLPKPSPTVMLNRLKNGTKYQLLGYKTVLFFKYYKLQKTKNPFKYYSNFRKQWKLSTYWANKLMTA